jgi:hypothetical protein
MAAESKNGMQCAEFEALLSDALDLTLSGEKLESFQAHSRVCPLCGPMLQEAETGQRWLKTLEVVEPPANLVHNILAATSGVETRRHGEAGLASWRERLTATVVAPALALMRQPRFAMSFGMVFFSLSICLSVLGIKPSDLLRVDLRPSAIKRSYYETSGRVVKYYENIRFVYEIESRVREFKRVTAPVEQAPEEQPTERKKNNNSEQHEQRQERNYSQGDNQPVLAVLPHDPPVVMVTTYRRYL